MLKGEEGKVETPEVKVADVKATPDIGNSDASDITEADLAVVQDDVDVSDEALKAAMRAEKEGKPAVASVPETEKVATPDKKESEVKEEDPLAGLEDAILAEVTKEETPEPKGEEESLADKTDRPEINKVKELERKLAERDAELAEMNQTRPEAQVSYSDEFFEKLAAKHGTEINFTKKVVMLLEDAFSTSVKPMLKDIVGKVAGMETKEVQSKSYSELEKDKLFRALKADVDNILATDEDIKSLPIANRAKMALKLAKANNLEKIVEATKKHVEKSTAEKRKVIPSSSGTVSKATPAKKSGIQFSTDDLRQAGKLGISQKDLDGFDDIPDSFIER
jgi:hypothetical protein